MASSHHRHPHPQHSSSVASSSSKKPNSTFLSVTQPQPYPLLLQNPTTASGAESADGDGKNPTFAVAATGMPPHSIIPAPEDVYLSNSSHLTYQEVLRRRLHNVKQLKKVYSDHYWAMMKELRDNYREYVWKYGLSPFKEEEEREIVKEEAANVAAEASDETGVEVNVLCAFYGCRLKAKALTGFCHLHILSDPKQILYKPCEYVIKSAQAGPITCGRPILRARFPAFCNVHLQKAHRALKKAGRHISSSNKLAPKFHVILAEYVRQIQAKRSALKVKRNNVVVKQESCN